MTSDQKTSISSVKGNYAVLNDREDDSGTFKTKDIKVVLQYLEDLEDKLICIKEDIEELLCIVQNRGYKDEVLEGMMQSTLLFLGAE